MELKGTRKLAALVLMLERTAASRLLQGVPEERLPEIGREMLDLAVCPLPEEEQIRILTEFRREIDEETGRPDPVQRIRGLIEASHGNERAEPLLERIRNSGSPWSEIALLEDLEPAAIAEALRYEQPQVAAIFLRELDSTKAAEILAILSDELRTELLLRMASRPPASPDVVARIVRSLRRRAKPEEAAADPRRLKRLAELLNRIPGGEGKKTLASLAERDAGLAEKLKELRFVFDDLILLERKNLQKALGSIDMALLTRALHSTSPELKERILGNVSRRVRERIEEEMESTAEPSQRERIAAQREIVKTIISLADAGQVDLMARDRAES